TDPGPVPPGDYLMIDAVAPNIPAAAAGEVGGPRFATWDRTDPILHYVDLSGVRVARALALAPQGGRVLAGGDVPLLWAYEGGGIRALVLGFALQDSDLPQRVAFPILMANSLAGLGGGLLSSQVPLWPWFLLGAVGVAVGEWVLATRRPGGEA